MKKFEYKTFFYDLNGSAKSDKELTKLGNEGWEAITAFPMQLNKDLTVLVYPLKREITD